MKYKMTLLLMSAIAMYGCNNDIESNISDSAVEGISDAIEEEATEEVTETIDTIEEEVTEEVTETIDTTEEEVTEEVTETIDTIEEEVTEEVTENIDTIEEEVTEEVTETIDIIEEEVTEEVTEIINTIEEEATEEVTETIDTIEEEVTEEMTETIDTVEEEVIEEEPTEEIIDDKTPPITQTATTKFIHPGITHKSSDLDRIKYMVESEIDPWFSSYQEMVSDSKSSYNYTVQGDASFTELGRDSGVNYNAWNSDIRAAYYNAMRWYVEADARHAEKAIEIFNAWSNLNSVTSGGTDSLSGGIGYIMIEAAELIKSTYSGWSDADIKAFSDMLVYPGYSTTAAPTNGTTTFYWMSYQGDDVRHGNQGLSGWRTVMAMGIFLDNDIMYDRALRQIKGESHRSDDLAYPSGPHISTSLKASSDYVDTYNIDRGDSTDDYGFNAVMTNYIWDNGQIQESSRDNQHTAFGLGMMTSMAEMAWNQGDDLYSHEDSRLLLGLEYNLRYNVSAVQSYSDQPSPWQPTVASGEFKVGFDRTGRWYSKAISPDGVGEIFSGVRPVFEMPVAHYVGRGFKSEDEVKWTIRGRDTALNESGYEIAGWKNDALGWGALTARRPRYCYGDPISGFDSNGLPVYAMNVLPMTIEAENFDYSPVNQNNRTFNDTSTVNKGNAYRSNESVDIQTSKEGGYNVGWIDDEEWLSYTVYVPSTGNYNLSLKIAALNSGGSVKVLFDGDDKSDFIDVPSTGDWEKWQDLTLAEEVTLTQGVQSMRILVGSGGFNIDNITVKLLSQP